MAKARNLVRDIFEYLLFCAIRLKVALLPRSWALGLGRGLGSLLYLLDGRHRAIAKKNIARVMNLPEGQKDIRRISRAVFKHLGQIAVEFALMPDTFIRKDGGEKILALEGVEKVREALAHGRGLIFITGHTGNWELMGACVSECLVPISSVARPLRNRYLDAYVTRRRAHYGQTLIPKKRALIKIARILKEGGVVGFLMDQHAGRSEPKLDFLGVPAHTYSSPGALAVRFQVPVVAGFSYRIGNDFRYKGYFEDPLYPDPDKDPSEEQLRITRAGNRAIERYVKAHPEQWLWMHRRWR